jgi:hypothetical protein
LECLSQLQGIDMLVQDDLSGTILNTDTILNSMRTTYNSVAARLFSQLPHLAYVHIDRSIRLRVGKPISPPVTVVQALEDAEAPQTPVESRYQNLIALFESRTFQRVDFSVAPPPPAPNPGLNVPVPPIVAPVT